MSPQIHLVPKDWGRPPFHPSKLGPPVRKLSQRLGQAYTEASWEGGQGTAVEATDQHFCSSSAKCRLLDKALNLSELCLVMYKTKLKILTFSTLQGHYEDQEYHVHEHNLQP